MSTLRHPADVLFDEGDSAPLLPVCDHYSGIEARMRKSLALQAELGPIFDVTLDGEDGAPAGGEVEHAHLMAELVNSPLNQHGRVGARVVPVEHPAFVPMLEALLPKAGAQLAYLMLPKPRDLAEVERGIATVDSLCASLGLSRPIPLHTLIETHGALRDVQAIAALPRLESLSFGLMDLVSAHRGAIPQWAMGVQGQFQHPLVLRAKLEIAAACHTNAKVPSHCVVTEFKDTEALKAAARQAGEQLGYTRMWSIHPDQIRPIVEALSPSAAEVQQAVEILLAAQAADWAPIRHATQTAPGAAKREQLHDRASYRYFWQVLQRAWRSRGPAGLSVPEEAIRAFWPSSAGHA